MLHILPVVVFSILQHSGTKTVGQVPFMGHRGIIVELLRLRK